MTIRDVIPDMPYKLRDVADVFNVSEATARNWGRGANPVLEMTRSDTNRLYVMGHEIARYYVKVYGERQKIENYYQDTDEEIQQRIDVALAKLQRRDAAAMRESCRKS